MKQSGIARASRLPFSFVKINVGLITRKFASIVMRNDGGLQIVKLGPRQKVAFQSGGWWLALAVTQKQTRYANQDPDKGAKLVLLNRCMLIGKLSL